MKGLGMNLPEIKAEASVPLEFLKFLVGPKKDKLKVPSVIKKGTQKRTLYEYACHLRADNIELSESEIRSAVEALATERGEKIENLQAHLDDIMTQVMKLPHGTKPPPKEVSVSAKPTESGKSYIIGDDAEWIRVWGCKREEYFYSSDENPYIICISATGHIQNRLLGLKRLGWWEKHFSDERSKTPKIRWDRAASKLMEAAKKTGSDCSEWNHRGGGAWKHKGETILNLGRSIYYLSSGKSEELGRIDSSHIFTVSKSLRAPLKQIPETFRPQSLVEICKKLSFRHKHDYKLLVGWLTLAPFCGALKWRPHIWLTGPKGTGKSTILDMIIKPILGERGIFVQGETTAAGIRQKLKADAFPLFFDEAETSNKQSLYRMRQVIELLRQCSSDSDAVTLKGSAGGTAVEYKPSSMACLSSIRVLLEYEQDISRFSELELVIPQNDNWKTLRVDIGNNITNDYGDKLFSLVCSKWNEVEKLIFDLEDQISDELNDRRIAQQYAPLLAGYQILSGEEVDEFDIELTGGRKKKTEETSDSDEAFQTFCMLEVSIEDDGKNKRAALGWCVRKAMNTDAAMSQELTEHFGIKVESDFVYIKNTNPILGTLLKETKWQNVRMLMKALSYLGDVRVDARCRFPDGKFPRCFAIPVGHFYSADNATR